MRHLNQNEMKMVAGGSDPKLVCVPATVNVTHNSDGSSTSISTQTCQTSSGLTIINTTSMTSVETGLGATAIGKALGLEAHVNVINTTSTTTVCTPNQGCTVLKTSDATDFTAPADNQLAGGDPVDTEYHGGGGHGREEVDDCYMDGNA